MSIYKISGSKLNRISEKTIELERKVQSLTENNIEEIFKYQLIRGFTKGGEFSLKNFRIDSLAFDEENKSFVIFEYKRDRSSSIVDQGYTYLGLLLNNKADFVLEYNEQTGKNLKKDDIDWSQSKVVFIAQSFTIYQENAISFKDLPIELWEVKIYDNDTILYNQLISPESAESINTISKNKNIKKVSKEIKIYSIEDHIKNGKENSINLFNMFKYKIIELDQNIKIDPQKFYIAFKVNNTNIVDIEIQKNSIKLWINLKFGSLQDPRALAKDMRNIGHRGNGDYELSISDDKNFAYIYGLIEQSYKDKI